MMLKGNRESKVVHLRQNTAFDRLNFRELTEGIIAMLFNFHAKTYIFHLTNER